MSAVEKQTITPADVGTLAVEQGGALVVDREKKSMALPPSIDFGADAGSGFEGVGARDMAIPFLVILQKGSPQVDEAARDKYVQGAVAGMIMNNVTGELHSGKDGILVLPCGFKKSLVEWKSRDSGGGLVGLRSENDPALSQFKRNLKNQLEAPNSNIIVDTAYHHVLHIKPDGTYGWAVIGMYSTQLKASRNWIYQQRNIVIEHAGKKFNPASWSHAYRLTTVGQSRDQYNWWGWDIKVDRVLDGSNPADVELYRIGKEFAKAVSEGAVQVSAPPQEFEPSAEGHAGSDEVPF